MILTKDAILKADDLKKELVSVPEWGGDVYVRGMSGVDRDRFEILLLQTSKDKKFTTENFRAKLASMSICDERGKLLFTEKDVLELANKSASALQRIFVVAQRLSGMGQTNIEELAEGLQENPLDDSVSDLP